MQTHIPTAISFFLYLKQYSNIYSLFHVQKQQSNLKCILFKWELPIFLDDLVIWSVKQWFSLIYRKELADIRKGFTLYCSYGYNVSLK